VAASVCAFIAFGKVFSPQYLVWLVPLVALVRGRRGMLATGLLVVSFILTNLWYGTPRFDAYVATGQYAWLVLTRNLIVVLLMAVLAVPTQRTRFVRRSAEPIQRASAAISRSDADHHSHRSEASHHQSVSAAGDISLRSTAGITEVASPERHVGFWAAAGHRAALASIPHEGRLLALGGWRLACSVARSGLRAGRGSRLRSRRRQPRARRRSFRPPVPNRPAKRAHTASVRMVSSHQHAALRESGPCRGRRPTSVFGCGVKKLGPGLNGVDQGADAATVPRSRGGARGVADARRRVHDGRRPRPSRGKARTAWLGLGSG
jgi:hypothetical protein